MGEEPHKPRRIRNFYEKQYKLLLLIPFLLLIAAIVQISVQTATTGDFINKGVSLKGGVIITVDAPAQPKAIEEALKNALPNADSTVSTITQQGVQTGTVINIDIDPTNEDELKTVLDSLQSMFPELTRVELQANIQTVTAQFSNSFFTAVIRALVLAFIFMGIVVFIYFRSPVPSLAVILAAASDIIITLAIVNILGIKLSAGGIAAFLMLIGYSVDTDILLTTKVLKEKAGSVTDRVIKAMKTGVMMNVTTLTAILVALFYTNSAEIKQIMIILLIGLIIDNINTWIQNVGILRYYLERKNRHNVVN